MGIEMKFFVRVFEMRSQRAILNFGFAILNDG
jgi:hypothetical protein